MSVDVLHATKVIGPDKVLDDVSITVPDGRVTGLQGINGSGKTMLMRAVCGFLRLSSGTVSIDGRIIGRDIEFPPDVGLLIEGPAFLPDRTALWNLRHLAGIRAVAGEGEVRRALERVGLDPDLKKPYRAYSLGMRQRVGIAAALMEEPALIVLDEPTNALDEDGIEMVKGILREERERGAAILLSCHDSEVLESLADRIYVLRCGRVQGGGDLDEAA